MAGNSVSWSWNSRSVYFLAGDHGVVSVFRAGTANGSVSKVVGGDRAIDGFDLHPDGQQVVFSSSWTTSPGAVYATHFDNSRMRTLSDANNDLLTVPIAGLDEGSPPRELWMSLSLNYPEKLRREPRSRRPSCLVCPAATSS